MPTNPVTTHHDFMPMLKRHVAFSNFFLNIWPRGFANLVPVRI